MMLASLRNLVYLDFRRIDPKDRATAEDQQPEILSNHLAREEQERHAAADAEQVSTSGGQAAVLCAAFVESPSRRIGTDDGRSDGSTRPQCARPTCWEWRR